ncbi:MAG: GxxExxY protein [Spirochaetota bacterium]|nr:GxxExxY protein [Spirochaetota bacterium]
MVVEDVLMVGLKSVKRIVRAHEMQLVNYLTSIGKPVGLIINCGELIG